MALGLGAALFRALLVKTRARAARVYRREYVASHLVGADASVGKIMLVLADDNAADVGSRGGRLAERDLSDRLGAEKNVALKALRGAAVDEEPARSFEDT